VSNFDDLAPPSDREIIRRYVRGEREQFVFVRRAADSIEEGRPEEADTLLESTREKGSELQGIAQGYGFKVWGAAD
jgi:hypothetical protein